MRLSGILPLKLEIGDEWRDPDEIEGLVADDLVGNVDVARLGVLVFGALPLSSESNVGARV